jgi:hypothetical protein
MLYPYQKDDRALLRNLQNRRYIFLVTSPPFPPSRFLCVCSVSYFSHVESGSNTSTDAPRVARGDEKGTQCLRLYLGRPDPGGFKHGDLALQVWRVPNLRQQNMVMSLAGLEPESHWDGEG